MLFTGFQVLLVYAYLTHATSFTKLPHCFKCPWEFHAIGCDLRTQNVFHQHMHWIITDFSQQKISPAGMGSVQHPLFSILYQIKMKQKNKNGTYCIQGLNTTIGCILSPCLQESQVKGVRGTRNFAHQESEEKKLIVKKDSTRHKSSQILVSYLPTN